MDLAPQRRLVLGAIVLLAALVVVLRQMDPSDSPPGPSAISTATDGMQEAHSSGPPGATEPAGVPASPPTAQGAASPTAESEEPRESVAQRPPVDAESHPTNEEGLEDQDEDGGDDDTPEPPRTIWGPDKDGIDGAVREKLVELRDCYQQWLRMDPDIEGSVVIEFTITEAAEDDPDAPRAEDGTLLAYVDEAGLDSTVEHPFMEGCVSNVFEGLWFSAPPEGRMSVKYPMVFSSE